MFRNQLEDCLTLQEWEFDEDDLEENYQKAEPFCDCIKKKSRNHVCDCGEEDTVFEWDWDKMSKPPTSEVSEDGREVKFHQRFSSGTAAVRGSIPMKNKQYYWEVKMTSPVYGTDVMVGVGTAAVDLEKYRETFFSLLGSDSESWGLSYTGVIHHKGEKQYYAPKFGQGSIIGVHLDLWNGTLAFFNNRQPLGIAYNNLHGKTVYPMVSSTAARSGMKIIKCHSFDTTLQYLCLLTLRKRIPSNLSLLQALNLPPGLHSLLENNIDWLVCSVPKKSTLRCQHASCKRIRVERHVGPHPLIRKRLCHMQ